PQRAPPSVCGRTGESRLPPPRRRADRHRDETALARSRDGPRPEWSAPLLVIPTVDIVHARQLLDLGARDLPCALHDPRERTVQTGRLLFDLLEHGLGEV